MNDDTPWHVYHERFVFVTVFDGHCVSKYRKRYHDVDARSLSVMVPGEFHRVMRVVAPTTFDVMFIDVPYLLKLLPTVDRVDGIDFRASIFRASDEALELSARLRKLVSDGSDALGIEEALVAFLAQAVGIAGEHPKPRPLQSDKVHPKGAALARQYLDEHLLGLVDLLTLSGIAGCDPHCLVRSFRRLTGFTPKQYQLQRRIALAERFLAKGIALAEVAAQAGFFDQPHFHRHFRRIVGVTPGEYRKGVCPSRG